jgi:hypothetical protein
MGEVQMIPVTFESLPWNTHPIDIVHGPQGWGPFAGPWSPQDYVPAVCSVGGQSGVSNHWCEDAYTPTMAPGYADITVFTDRSQDLVNGVVVNPQNNGAQNSVQYSSTIANALTRAKEISPPGPSLTMSAIRDAVMQRLGG